MWAIQGEPLRFRIANEAVALEGRHGRAEGSGEEEGGWFAWFLDPFWEEGSCWLLSPFTVTSVGT